MEAYFFCLAALRPVSGSRLTICRLHKKNGGLFIMKNNMFKKLMALGCAAVLTVSMLGCSSSKAEETAPADTTAAAETETEDEAAEATGETYKVAIIKQLDHASLDEIEDAICAELDVIAAENGITIEIEKSSGQNDQSTLKQLGDQAIADGVDAIIPIATLAAQVATLCAEDTQTPVIFAAISDPEAAELTGIDYVTGTSDALNTSFILDMMLAQNPDVQKVGLLYSLSETNSVTPIAEAKAYLDEKGIAYTEATANTNDEVKTAASTLIAAGVDAIFTPTDNVIMAAELAIYEDLAAAGIPHYTGADSFVRNGAFTTCGVNYTDLGTRTADLAFFAMTEGMANLDDYYLMDGGIITVNTETAAALNVDYSVFEDMGEVVEVTTTED
jgi:putative ABC transport system substrate-binding protein